jgi:hypothetical protein
MIDIEERRDGGRTDGVDDPVLLMRGVGKQLWEQEPGDRFIERLRSEDLSAVPVPERIAGAAEALDAEVWRRIAAHQGEQFRTATKLPFTYEVDRTGMWFFRNGRRINKRLTRKQLNIAISRCPLSKTTEIKDIMDFAYVFGLLADSRIKAEAW